jgi:uncharacterized protein YjcR
MNNIIQEQQHTIDLLIESNEIYKRELARYEKMMRESFELIDTMLASHKQAMAQLKENREVIAGLTQENWVLKLELDGDVGVDYDNDEEEDY